MSETLGCGHPDKNRACGDCLDEAEAEVTKLELQVDVFQKRMEAIVKVASKPCSIFPKSMATMTEIEGKIAIVACELSGDLSYIKGLAESPIIEKRVDDGPVCSCKVPGSDCKRHPL